MKYLEAIALQQRIRNECIGKLFAVYAIRDHTKGTPGDRPWRVDATNLEGASVRFCSEFEYELYLLGAKR